MPGPTSTTPWCWLKADAGVYKDAGSTLAADGDLWAQWNDQSGNARNWSAAVSGTYHTNQRKGLPALSFAGSHYLTYSGTPLDPGCIFFVVKATDTTGFHSVLGCVANSGNSYDGYYLSSCANNATYRAYQRTTGTDTTGVFPNQWQPYTYGYVVDWTIMAVRNDGTTIRLYVGDCLAASATNSGTGVKALTGPMSLGAAYFNHAVSDQINGQIGEVLLYSADLSDAEFQQVIDYLKGRWFSTPTDQFLLSTFQGNYTLEFLRLLTGTDGSTFTSPGEMFYRPDPTDPNAAVRDPSNNFKVSTYYLAHTARGATSSAGSTFNHVDFFTVAKSTDLISWTRVVKVDCSSLTPTYVWAPEWVVNDDGTLYLDGSGLPHLLFTATSDADPITSSTNFKLYEVHPTTSDESQWSNPANWSAPVQLSGTGWATGSIDPFGVYRSGTFHVYWQDKAATTIKRSTASSITGPYSLAETLPWGTGIEGPSVFKFNAGATLRGYYDRFGAGTGLAYRDSTDGGATWGAETGITAPFTTRHGTVCNHAPPPPFLAAWAVPANPVLGSGVF